MTSETQALPPIAAQTPILIELFQSQGCNACPPTNETLISFIQAQQQSSPSLAPGRFYASRTSTPTPSPNSSSSTAPCQEYILLTYQVTYWNYLGWTDTLALHANDTRQSDYVRRKRLQAAYTPMVVVNGRGVGIGNSKSDFERILREGTIAVQGVSKSVSRSESETVRIQKVIDFNITIDDSNNHEITLGIDASTLTPSPSSTLEIHQITYSPTSQDVHISSGENTGRTLPHLNVVRDIRRIGYLERGARGRFRVEGVKKRVSLAEGRVVIVQDGKGGDILGLLKV